MFWQDVIFPTTEKKREKAKEKNMTALDRKHLQTKKAKVILINLLRRDFYGNLPDSFYTV